MNIRIRIERMVLDGTAMTKAQMQGLQKSLETELARLVEEGRLSREILAGGMLREISVGYQAQSASQSPSVIGRRIASAIYGGIGEEKTQARRTTKAAASVRGKNVSSGGVERNSFRP